MEDAPEAVKLRVQNRILPAPDRADSHGFGVPTMKKLLSRFGGSLEILQNDGFYTSILVFPKHGRNL